MMESPKSSKDIGLKEIKTNVYFYERRTPLRNSTDFGKDHVSPSCNLIKSHKNDMSPEVEVHNEDFSHRNNSGEPSHSTPLRVGCDKRQCIHCVEPCCHSNGHLKTPVTNSRKTPLKVPVNPFDAVLLDRLHLPICSPSIFTRIVNNEDNEFKWNIEQQATLFPAPIEEEVHGHHHMYEHFDPETESKLQAAIDRFYESKLIAPSPWIGTKKSDFNKGYSTFAAKFADDVFPTTRNSDYSPCMETKGSVTRDVCTQTQITLPPQLPAELECILQKYKLPASPKEESCSASSSISIMESESFSSSTLRRKLFFHMEEMSISQPLSPYAVETPSSPTHDKSLLPQAFSSPVKCGATLPDIHHSSETDEEESLPNFLESSQTTFWRDMSSPSLSPITRSTAAKFSEDVKVLKKPASEELRAEFTPPSSRAKHKPIFSFNFAPLLENDEEKEIEATEKMRTMISEDKASKIQNAENCASNKLNKNTNTNKNNNQKGEKTIEAQETFPNLISLRNRGEGFSNQNSNLMHVSNQQQMLAHDKVHSMEVSDCGASRMQDTGYQTVSMTTFPNSSSLSSSKTRNCSVMPMDVVTLGDKGTLTSKICEDGYISLTSIKLPLASEYNDESMCDIWHTTPSPIASSTPAKNITGFLM